MSNRRIWQGQHLMRQRDADRRIAARAQNPITRQQQGVTELAT
jgi:hypothetical protein